MYHNINYSYQRNYTILEHELKILSYIQTILSIPKTKYKQKVKQNVLTVDSRHLAVVAFGVLPFHLLPCCFDCQKIICSFYLSLSIKILSYII